jgi:hypothetical protein
MSEKLPELDWYRETSEHLKSIVFYGSRAKRTNRKDSDIDLLFIMPIEIEEKHTEGEYSYEFGGQEINIVIRSIERLRDIAAGEHDSFQAEIFRNSEIMWQRDSEADELIKLISFARKDN